MKTRSEIHLEPLPSPIIDSHAHMLMYEEVREVWSESEVSRGRTGLAEQSVGEIIAQAEKVGVTGIVECACDVDGIRALPEILREHSSLRGAIALHPNEAPLHLGIRNRAPDGLQKILEPRHQVGYSEVLAEIYQTLRDCPQITAVGETGLDFYRTAEEGRDAQIQAFRDHLQIAKELNLPVQIHDREAHSEILQVLDNFSLANRDSSPPVIMHSFSGNRDFAEQCIARGYFLSFSGTVTFKNSDSLRAALAVTPLAQLLLETDTPFLTPVPQRGIPNQPSRLTLTARFIADTLDVTLTQICQSTYNNAQQLFKMDAKPQSPKPTVSPPLK